MRANAQKRSMSGAGEKRNGRGKAKTLGNRDVKRSVERERDGAGFTGKTRWTFRTGTFRKKSREFEGGGHGWIIGGRKDHGFG